MRHDREDVLGVVIRLVRQLSVDWEDSGEVTEGTHLLDNMNWRSLDVVVLASDIQEHYGRAFPFAELFAEIGKRAHPDVVVGEVADFVCEHLNRASAPEAAD
jgi:acyl carrier protein